MPDAPSYRDSFDKAFCAVVKRENLNAYSVYAYTQRLLLQFHISDETPVDILDEVYLRARKQLDKGNPIESPFAWMKKTALHVIQERSRKHQKTQNLCLKLYSVLELDSTDADARSPTHFAALKRALSHLDRREREILCLRYIHSLSWRDIGTSIDKKENAVSREDTVRQQGHRALKKLKTRFKAVLKELESPL
jgi:RNA polymerase sigma factor (sigma-70 family)